MDSSTTTGSWLLANQQEVSTLRIDALSQSRILTVVIPAHFTIGATADSGYEYLLKQWLLSGDVQARDQCTLLFGYPTTMLQC